MRTRRRDFLLAAAALVGAGAGARLRPWTALLEVDRRAGAALRLARLVSERESALAVGAVFLREAGPREAGALVDAIAAEVPLAGRDDDELRRALAARVAEDHAQRRWVELDGWLVSVTEARMCGIVALVEA